MQYEAGLPAQEDSSNQLVEVLPPMSDLPAFPGAEGYAQYITGGRGGKVIHVTNLNTNGPGSFAEALDNNGRTDEPRIIVFDVAGTIQTDKSVAYSKSIKNVTIAGQSAPGEGITLTGENFYLKGAENVIIRYIHFRHGQATAKDDSFYVQASKNIMIDHCSFTYGSDEDCSARNTSNLTIQWSIVTNGVRTHSMGGLQEWNSETIHHCLWGNQNDRNPKAKGILDFTNNVVYNWGEYPFVAGGNSSGQGWGNVVNNYYIAGLDTKNPYRSITRSNGKYFLYLGGNLIDSNKNGVLDGVNTGVNMIGPGTPGDTKYPERFTFPDDYSIPLVLIKNRMDMATLENVDTAEVAYAKVLQYSGSSLYHDQNGSTVLQHDPIDTQIIDGVRNQTGKILLNNAEDYDENGVRFDQNYLNNRPVIDVNDASSEWYRPDSDQDGIPDAWETAHNLDPNNPEDRNELAPSGYTWIEEYLNELAAPGFPDEYFDGGSELAAAANRPERTYVLKLEDYNGETKEYEAIYGDNQIMVPVVPVAEYLGYKILGVAENVVTLEYPFTAASGLLNLDVQSGVITVKAGESRNVFSGQTNPNEKVRSYNGMLYIPVNLVSLGMGAVYEQTVADEGQNIVHITIHDAEVYKDWHNDSGIRNARKVAAPSMVVQCVDGGFKLVFDKEAAFAEGADAAAVTITAGGKDYTAAVKDADLWGSHKVAAFSYSSFTAADGGVLNMDGATAYTVKVGANAFADYYKGSLINGVVEIAVDPAAQASEKAAKQEEAQKLSDEIAGTLGGDQGQEYVPETEDASSVLEALKAMYKLMSMKEINAVTSDQINFDEPVPTPKPTAEPTPEPTQKPTPVPTAKPTPKPTAEPTSEPTVEPTSEPTVEPTSEPTAEPTSEPTEEPAPEPTEEPAPEPTEEPAPEPTEEPDSEPEEDEEPEVEPEPTVEPQPTAAPVANHIIKSEPSEVLPDSVMTEAVKVATKCNTVEELNEFMKQSVVAMVQGTAENEIARENIVVWDVVVSVSHDNGVTWSPATKDDFPAEGLKVVLKYPEGTNGEEYDFVVTHLITMDCNGLTAGQVINEPYTKTADGLELQIKSASPFAIGWSRVKTVSDEQPNTPAEQNSGDSVTPAKTGDSMGSFMWVWIVILVLAAAGIAVFAVIKVRGKGKDGNQTK